MILRALVGERLLRVGARRYPGYFSFDRIELETAGGIRVCLELQEHEVEPGFEVFPIRARRASGLEAGCGDEELRFSDFTVASVEAIRHREWLEAADGVEVVGRHPRLQRSERLSAGTSSLAPASAAIVTCGVVLESVHGARLLVLGDAFPLVMQMCYSTHQRANERSE